MLSIPVYADLLRVVEGLSADSSASDVVSAICGWVERNPEAISKPPFSEYGFELIERIAGRVDQYAPAELDDRAVGRIKASVLRLRRSDDGRIAQYLRDLMEELLAPEVEACCALCGEDFMQAFAGGFSSLLILQCKRCGHLQFRDGSGASGEVVRFLTARELIDLAVHDLDPK